MRRADAGRLRLRGVRDLRLGVLRMSDNPTTRIQEILYLERLAQAKRHAAWVTRVWLTPRKDA